MRIKVDGTDPFNIVRVLWSTPKHGQHTEDIPYAIDNQVEIDDFNILQSRMQSHIRYKYSLGEDLTERFDQFQIIATRPADTIEHCSIDWDSERDGYELYIPQYIRGAYIVKIVGTHEKDDQEQFHNFNVSMKIPGRNEGPFSPSQLTTQDTRRAVVYPRPPLLIDNTLGKSIVFSPIGKEENYILRFVLM